MNLWYDHTMQPPTALMYIHAYQRKQKTLTSNAHGMRRKYLCVHLSANAEDKNPGRTYSKPLRRINQIRELALGVWFFFFCSSVFSFSH